MVAQELALRYPDKIRALALICTSAGGKGRASFPLHELEIMAPADRVKRHLQISDTRRTDEWIAANPEHWQTLFDMTLAARRPDRDEVGAALCSLHADTTTLSSDCQPRYASTALRVDDTMASHRQKICRL